MTKRIYTKKYGNGEPMNRAENPDKAAILAFLKRQECIAATSGHFVDEVTGAEVDQSHLGYKAGGFTWDSRDVYHFEKYNLELNPEFCEYALAG